MLLRMQSVLCFRVREGRLAKATYVRLKGLDQPYSSTVLYVPEALGLATDVIRQDNTHMDHIHDPRQRDNISIHVASERSRVEVSTSTYSNLRTTSYNFDILELLFVQDRTTPPHGGDSGPKGAKGETRYFVEYAVITTDLSSRLGLCGPSVSSLIRSATSP